MIVFEAVFTSIGLIAQKRPTKKTLILLAKVLILYTILLTTLRPLVVAF